MDVADLTLYGQLIHFNKLIRLTLTLAQLILDYQGIKYHTILKYSSRKCTR